MKVTTFTKDVPEFLRVVRWCYDMGLGWVIAATCRDGECAVHLDLPDTDVRVGSFRELVERQPSWTVIAESDGLVNDHARQPRSRR